MKAWWSVIGAAVLSASVWGQCGMTPAAIIGDRALGIAKVADARFVVLKASSLDLWDLSDPSAPARVAQLNPSTSPGTSKPFTCMAADGGRVYAGFDDQVWILDAGGGSFSILGTVAVPSRVHRVQLHGGVMLTSAESQARFGEVEFRAVDVHDPAAPVALGAISMVGTWQYTPGRDAWMYVNTPSGVTLVDFADPLHPSATATGLGPVALAASALDGQRLWVADPAGTRAYDVSIPSTPRSLGVYPGTISDVLTVDGVSYFRQASPSRLVAADLSGVATPILLGESPATGTYIPAAPGLLAAPYSTGLRTLEVSHPEAMAVRSVATESTGPIDRVTSAGSVLVAFAPAELVTLDVSDPAHPARLGSTPFSSSGSPGVEAAAGSDGVVVFAGSDRLRVIDLLDPSAPRVRGTLPLPAGFNRDAAVDGRLAAVQLAASTALVDLSDLDNPRLLGEVRAVSRSVLRAGLSLDAGRLAIAADTLHLYDVSDPAHPTLLRQWNWTSATGSVALRGDVLGYSNFTDSAVYILDPGDETRIGGTRGGRSGFPGLRRAPEGLVTSPPGFISPGDPQGAYLREWVRPDMALAWNWWAASFAAVPGSEALAPFQQGLWVFGRGQPQAPAIRGGFSTDRQSLHPCIGEPFDLGIDAVSSTGEVSYQWYDRMGHAMPGETSATLRIPRFTGANLLPYFCIATNACGSTAYPYEGGTSSMWSLCAADFNCDAFVDFFDDADFVDAFERGDLRADVDGNEFLDFFDYDDFLQAFERGC